MTFSCVSAALFAATIAVGAHTFNAAAAMFDDLQQKELLPLHRMDEDRVRQELDERLAIEVLQLPFAVTGPDGALNLLRRKLAREPSIRGRKGREEPAEE